MKLSINKILKNAVALLATKGIDVIIMVLMIAAIARYLGPEMYGEYAFIITLVTFLVTSTFFGIERIIIRNIARNKKGADITFGTALVTRWIMSSLVMVILLIVIFVTNFRWEVRAALMMAAVSQLALSSANLYMAVFKAYEKMEYETLITFIFQILTLGLILLVVTRDLGFLPIFAVVAVANLGRFVASLLLCSRKILKPKFTIDATMIKALLKDAFILGINLLFVQALMRGNVLLLKAMKESVEVSYFHASHSLLLHLQVIPVALSTALFPSFSRSAQNDHEALSVGFEKAFKLMCIVGGLIAIVGTFLSPLVINLVYGQEFAKSIPALQILFPASIFLFLHPLLSFVLISKEKQSLLIPASIGAFVTGLVLSLILIPHYGYIGASISNLTGYAVLFTLTLYFTMRHVININLGKILFEPVAVLVCIAPILYIFRGKAFILLILFTLIVGGLFISVLKRTPNHQNNPIT